MPDQKYKTIVTAAGKEKVAAAVQSGGTLNVTQAAVGDGGGSYYVPTEDMTQLRAEKWRGSIASMRINMDMKNVIDVKVTVPANVGGFTVREAALFDDAGAMFAVCNLPDIEKAAVEEGTAGTLTVFMHIALTNADRVEFKVDPSIDTVTEEDVERMIEQHKQTAETTSYDKQQSKLQAENVQAAIDEFVEKFNAHRHSAEDTSYSDGTSKLQAENVQAAIDEFVEKFNAHRHSAEDTSYSDGTSKLQAENVQAAIDAFVTKFNTHKHAAKDTSYDGAASELQAENVQAAIDAFVTKFNAHKHTAKDTSYDGSASELEAATVQDVLDALAKSAKEIEDKIGKIKLTAADTTYDDAKNKFGVKNVQDAIDALIAGTLPKLTIKVTAESTLRIVNGETTLNGKADTSGSYSLYLPHGGTWEVFAELNGKTTDDIIDIDAVGKEFTLSLVYFSSTLKVTAVNGAAVTAVKGRRKYTGTAGADGIANLTIKEAGSYTVSATYQNAKSNEKTVSVSQNGGTDAVSVEFITLQVTAPVESNIKVDNGNTHLTGKVASAPLLFYLPNTGVWTVTANKGEEESSDTVSVTEYKQYKMEIAYVKIYGVEWDKTASTRLSRTDDAVLFQDPTPAVSGGSGSSPFDNCMPWKGMVQETLNENALIKIPKYWYKWTDEGGKLKLQIADRKAAGFHVSPAHADRGDGKGERDYVYIGRYKCGSDYKSKTKQSPKVNITRKAARDAIKNLGTGYYQQDFAMFWTVRMLYLVEFADWDSQAAIGFGCGNNSSAEQTGSSDTAQYHTGTMKSKKDEYGVGVQYRHIEDPWGNVREWCDGIRFKSSEVYVFNNPAEFSDDTGGTKTGTRPTSSGYISAWGVPSAEGYEWALYPSAVAGSETTYVADCAYCSSSNVVLYVGGDYGQYRSCGAFYLSDGAASSSVGNIGARLQYLP